MPHQDRDGAIEELPSERRQRVRGEKDPKRSHRSSRSSRPKVIDPETGQPVRSSHRRRKDKEKEVSLEPVMATTNIVPELARTSSNPGSASRSSIPYPSFSKAHSKENVNSIEHLPSPVVPSPVIPSPVVPDPGPYTPESTDLGSGSKPQAKSADGLESGGQVCTQTDGRPPTPPDTEFSQQRKGTPIKLVREWDGEGSQPRPGSQGSQRSWFNRSLGKDKDDRSKVSTKSKQSKTSKTSTIKTSRIRPAQAAAVVAVDDDDEIRSDISDAKSASAIDSNATSVAPHGNEKASGARKTSLLGKSMQPGSTQDTSPKPPGSVIPDHGPSPSPYVSFDIPDSQDEAYDSPKPPPPPPPPLVPINIPRVDYLMQNGGLSRTVPRTLLAVTPSNTPQPFAGRPAAPAPNVDRVFGTFHILLDQYGTVIAKNGSVAVATGYRSVARRLLDRLEAVFARDLSSEGCFCVMCQQNEPGEDSGKGLGWGEVLEWVSGRRGVPGWPAFDFSKVGIKGENLNLLGISEDSNSSEPNRPSSPVKLDPDIAEEFREHYLKQSKKTKLAVSQWLSSTPASLSAPPPDVDDETLTFTILTHLGQEERPFFSALMTGSMKPVHSISRAPTPLGKPRPDFVVKTGHALQRLYRLPEPPRDPESCIYLLKNPHMHNLLATLSGINVSEWEILTSGRFDGFLWSGAESEFPGSMLTSPAASRNPTPAPMGLPSRGPTPAGRHPSFSKTTTPSIMRNQTFSPPIAGFPSRGPTPSQFMAPMSVPGTPVLGQARGPVSNDEETEIAVLAEIEREIYTGMEALEDAFEALHRKAESVRQALRERSAGLSMAAQARRVSNDGSILMRLGTPAGNGYERGWNAPESDVEAESDWGGDEAMSELAPDDSASNISSSRVRRPMRRNERRTPAPVEEMEEDG